jgi:hypothetical protein
MKRNQKPARAAGAARTRPGRKTFAEEAIARAREAYRKAYDEARAGGKVPIWAERDGEGAYRTSMPKLDSIEEIRAFIACVADGMTLNVFRGAESGKMLYAAQVALSLMKVTRKGGRDA